MAAVHLAGEPIGGEVQFCTRCGIVLADYSRGDYASSDGSPPSFWSTGAPILVANGFKISLEVALPDRDRSDEIDCG